MTRARNDISFHVNNAFHARAAAQRGQIPGVVKTSMK